MVEISLERVARNVDEATINFWFIEEGNAVEEGEDLLELLVGGTAMKVTSPCSGTLSEVFYTESDIVSTSDVLCEIDDKREE